MFEKIQQLWSDSLNCAITVCDNDGIILYMNQKSKSINGGDKMIGKNLFDCHNQQSKQIIIDLISKNQSNSYTIEKKGIKKLIHQTPWYIDNKVAGLVEISIEIPNTMPHHIRS